MKKRVEIEPQAYGNGCIKIPHAIARINIHVARGMVILTITMPCKSAFQRKATHKHHHWTRVDKMERKMQEVSNETISDWLFGYRFEHMTPLVVAKLASLGCPLFK
jgi:hypothetical protein